MRIDAQKDTSTTGNSSRCCKRRASQGANIEMLLLCAIPVRMLYAYKIFDRVTYTQNRQVMPRNCRRLKPPAKRRAEDSAVPIPLMVASLAQVTVECGAPNLGSGTKPSLGGTTSTASRRRGWLSARLISASPNTITHHQ